jgi:hypothetical protein
MGVSTVLQRMGDERKLFSPGPGYAIDDETAIGRDKAPLGQASARGLSRDYPMMSTATIADSRGASVSRKKAIPSSIA